MWICDVVNYFSFKKKKKWHQSKRLNCHIHVISSKMRRGGGVAINRKILQTNNICINEIWGYHLCEYFFTRISSNSIYKFGLIQGWRTPDFESNCCIFNLSRFEGIWGWGLIKSYGNLILMGLEPRVVSHGECSSALVADELVHVLGSYWFSMNLTKNFSTPVFDLAENFCLFLTRGLWRGGIGESFQFWLLSPAGFNASVTGKERQCLVVGDGD